MGGPQTTDALKTSWRVAGAGIMVGSGRDMVDRRVKGVVWLSGGCES